jgi:hypothetical protein
MSRMLAILARNASIKAIFRQNPTVMFILGQDCGIQQRRPEQGAK